MGLTRVTGNIIGLGVSVSGIVTATDFHKADGSPIGGGGLGTAISESNDIYFVDNILGIGATVTVTVPDTTGNNTAYTQYPEIAVDGDADLIISDGDDLVLDILGIGTDPVVPRSGSGGRVRADNFTDNAGTGAPTFNTGLQVTGVATATSFVGNVTGDVTGNVTGNVTANSITVGDKFINSSGVGLGQTTTAGRNAGINTAIGTIIYNTNTFQTEVYKGANFGWQNISHSLTQATGGQVSDYIVGSTVYRAHIFNSSGTFDVTNLGPGTVDLLLIAGGGGGGGSWSASNIGQGGGGGAGGLFYRNDVAINPGANAVVIGAGGVGDGYMEGGNAGTDGGDSTALGITADGGGRGGSYGSPGYNGGTGGSGGGAGYARNPGPATGAGVADASVVDLISPPAGWGRAGGDYSNTAPGYSAGGGGGAAYAGTSGSATAGGPGGDGLRYSIVGFTTYYAGGGGGGTDATQPGNAGVGGVGGGGAGSDTSTRAFDAIVNTGGGGGGGGNGPGSSYGQGAAGGSGIAVIRYQLADLTAAAKATGGYISYANGKTIHKFEKTGVFTITDSSLTSVDALVIGGGGAGGNGAPGSHYGGGGGAGALHYQTNLPVSNASPYAVSVGAGGVATWYTGSNGTTGASSVFSTITAAGGGAGRGTGPGAAFNGGSGGGAAYPGGAGGTGSGDTGGTDNSVSPSNGWGNDGAAYSSDGHGGAGGGAGGIGGVSLANNSDGGLGLSYNISGSATTYATGGAGNHTGSPGGRGEAYTGNGGNGGRLGYAHPQRNSNGGSGIVIISYPT